MSNEYRKLKEKLEETENLRLEFKDNAYYMFDCDKKEGPYCSCCYDFHGKLVHLHSKRDSSRNEDIYFCPKCKIEIEMSDEND